MEINFFGKKLKLEIYDFLFILLLAFSLFIRVNNFTNKYAVGDGDVSRDYLVAHHIIKYHEYPSVGPWNSVYISLRNSPLYYYLLAFFLLIKDDIIFLGRVNVFLHIFAVILIYLLAKRIFSSGTGFIATLLFSFSQEIFTQSTFLWQPHIMQPFILLSYYLFTLAYVKNNFPILIIGIFSYSLSAALHYSVFPTLPMTILLIIYVLKLQEKNKVDFILAFLALGFSIFLFYLPVIISLLKDNAVSFFIVEQVYIGNPVIFFQNFINNILTLINIFFFNHDSKIYLLNNVLVFILLVEGIFYFLKRSNKQKKYLIFIFFFILQPLIFSSFLKTVIFYHYWMAVFGLFFILIAEIINSAFSDKMFFLKILFIILLVRTVSLNFYLMKWNYNDLNWNNVNLAAQAIEKEIISIQEDKKKKNLDFFRIALFKNGSGETVFDSVFWVQLEQKLNTKFVQVVDGNNNYEPINDDEYIFLVCQYYTDEIDETVECVDAFISGRNNYSVVKKISAISPFSIYLTKKNET